MPTTCEGKFQCTHHFRYAKTGSPHSQLAPACSLCSSSLPSLQLTPLTPAHSSLLQLTPSLLRLASMFQLAPAHSQLTPACSLLAPACSHLPAHSSLLPAHSSLLPMAMYVLGSPPPVGCKGLWGKVGESWSELGSELRSKLGSGLGSELGVSWSKLE